MIPIDLSKPGCGGTATVECLCGGDLCCCELQGWMPCEGCQDCLDITED